jgi:hypothetical protein
MWSRLDARSPPHGASVSLESGRRGARPGYESQLAAVVTTRVAEIQIKQLKFSGLGVNKTQRGREDVAGTDTSAEVKVDIRRR